MDPLVTLIAVNVIGLASVVVPGYFAYKNMKAKTQEIHVLVNARLTEALAEIKALKAQVAQADLAVAVVKEQAKVAEKIVEATIADDKRKALELKATRTVERQ